MLVSVGTFMLIYETLFVVPPNIDVLSVGGALLGVPMVVRLDLWASGNNSRSLPPADEEPPAPRRRKRPR
jgi:hypothetical protein